MSNSNAHEIMKVLMSVWAYRGFILSSVKREFQFKYRGTLFGSLWAVIHPLAMIFVYTVIFTQIMHPRVSGADSSLAYSIHLCAGILTWGLFSEIVLRAQNTFLENANILKKINFPKICLPIIVVLNGLVNFTIVFGLFTLFLILTGNFPGWPFLALLPLLFILFSFAIGLGVTLGVLNVFFRDVGQISSIFMQFWFWLTPIVYPPNVLPSMARDLMALNPIAPFMVSFQTILVQGQWPQWGELIYPSILALVLCLQGTHLFRQHADELVDEL